MSSQISYKDNKNRIKKKLSFFEGGHQLEKLEFALAIAPVSYTHLTLPTITGV